MARRSRKFYFFTSLLALVVFYAITAALKTGPVSLPLQSIEGANIARAAAMPGANCEELSVATKLTEDAWFSHDIVGDLCWTDGLEGKTVIVTVSGAGYNSLYWDFAFEPDTYSFTRAALRRGYVVFNFDRPGMGRSDRPFGISLGVDNQAGVLAQIIEQLRSEYSFASVVTVGHSFGSTISLAHALTYPDNVDGLVLTGFVHNSNPGFNLAMRDGVDLAAFKGPFAGSLLDPTYVISKPNSRGDIFYTRENTDPQVIEFDSLNPETTTIGEVITMSKYFKEQSKALTLPAFTLIGEDDFVVCGGAVECTDHQAITEWERAYFPPAACHEIVVLDDTNHNANLHRNAPDNYRIIFDWVDRRIGNGSPASDACRS